MLCCLIFVVYSADNFPYLSTECQSSQVYNSTGYGCESCSNGTTNYSDYCRPENQPYILENGAFVSECNDEGYTIFGGICFEISRFEEKLNYYKNLVESSSIIYYDTLTSLDSNTVVSSAMSEEFKNQLIAAMICYNVDKTNQTAMQMIGNACAVTSYDINSIACDVFNNNITQNQPTNRYGYRYWPQSGPFLHYGLNTPLEYVMSENLISTRFSIGQEITFQLGRFSKYGKFLGFTELKLNLQKCGNTNDIIYKWREFGTNYYSSCLIDLSELIESDTTDFFDPFIEDTIISGNTILRPIPVFLKNYRGTSSLAVNRQETTSNYRAARRFFLMDNYTSSDNPNGVIQYLTNLSIAVNVNGESIMPLFNIEYSQIRKTDIVHTDEIRFKEETLTHKKFTFEVMYLSNLDSFWQALLIVFCICIVVALIFLIFKMFTFCWRNASDGFNFSVFLGIIGYSFDIFSLMLFIISFAFSLYVFILFKFVKNTSFFLPPEEDFQLLIPVLWVAFGLKAISIICFILIQRTYNVFIVDWETPKPKDISISCWRRIMIGNEFCRINIIRSYNVTFTLLTIVFIIYGFDLDLLATPIPSTQLIDMGKQYFLLRYAFVSFIWLILILLEYIWYNFIYWNIIGNPFLNFVELCSSSNISVQIKTCNFHGYYINGKSDNEIKPKKKNQKQMKKFLRHFFRLSYETLLMIYLIQ